MPGTPEGLAVLLALMFLVAVAYSSVGHGGASGYLAVLSFFGLAPAIMAPSALVLNLLVAGTSFLMYWRAGHFTGRLLWPFLITSIPFAALGGLITVPATTYMAVLAGALLFASFRLALPPAKGDEVRPTAAPSLAVALPIGAVIGFVSGLVGVGGGIFLSPILILKRWADTKRTASVSAAFIWVNSAAGLYGHLSRKTVAWGPLVWLIAAAFAGGLLGSWLGAKRLESIWLRRVLAAVLVIASFKLLRSAF